MIDHTKKQIGQSSVRPSSPASSAGSKHGARSPLRMKRRRRPASRSGSSRTRRRGRVRRSSTAGSRRRRSCTPNTTLPMPRCAVRLRRKQRQERRGEVYSLAAAAALLHEHHRAGVEGDEDRGWAALFEQRRQRRNGAREAKHRLLLFLKCVGRLR